MLRSCFLSSFIEFCSAVLEEKSNMWKVNDEGRTTDNAWSQQCTWAFGSHEILGTFLGFAPQFRTKVARGGWEFEIKGVGDWGLGNLLLASNGDNGNLQNCWCLECCFSSQINISGVSHDENSNGFHWIKNNMSFVNSYKNYYQNLPTWVSHRLAMKVTPNENDAANLTRPCLWLPLPEWV